MAASVSGKVAFVTGGASGIGAALTTELVSGGAEVWIADRQIAFTRRARYGGRRLIVQAGGSPRANLSEHVFDTAAAELRPATRPNLATCGQSPIGDNRPEALLSPKN